MGGFTDYLAREGNVDAIITDLLVWSLIGIITFLIYVFRKYLSMFWNWVWRVFTVKLPAKLKSCKEKRKENKTIKQIERKEIPIPDYFLIGKENDPRFQKIFKMIDDGEIEAPLSYTLDKISKKLKLNEVDFPYKNPLPTFELFDPSKYIKK